MSKNTQIPVIFLAFANDIVNPSRRLGGLGIEKDSIRNALNLAQVAGLCEVVIESEATVDGIMNTFQNPLYKDRITIFHYAGHADGYQLLLEDRDQGNQVAEGEGLVSFFSKQKSLQLIFFNGCSTQKQTIELMEAGIPAVIGTSRSIADDIAVKLATRFYQCLGNNYSIDRAWEEAQDEFRIRGRSNSLTRDMAFDADESSHASNAGFPWNIYIREDQEERIKKWNLGEEGQNPLFGLPLPERYYRDLPEAPFPGLHYFTEKDTALFFGRGAQIRALYQKLRGPHPVILFYGKSGVGKSSLLFAGLKPRIEDKYSVAYIRRDQDSGLIGSLEQALNERLIPSKKNKGKSNRDHSNKEAGVDAKRLEEAISSLKRASGHLSKADIELGLERIIEQLNLLLPSSQHRIKGGLPKWRAIEAITGKPLLIILDQVEELYTRLMPGTKSGEQEFRDFLQYIRPLYEEGSQIKGRLMLSFRKEYLPEIQTLFEEDDLTFDYLFLQRLDKEGILEAVTGVERNDILRRHYHNLKIEKPSGKNGHKGLAELIAADLTSDPESPIAPVLQIIMRKLWDQEVGQQKPDYTLSVSEYSSLENTVGAFFREQIEKLRKDKILRDAEDSGLVLDVLLQHTTEKGTAGSCRLTALEARYPGRGALLKKMLVELEQLSILVLIERNPYTTLLAHDVLAPVVIQACNNSEYPGQRAAQILHSKMRNVRFHLSAESFGLLEDQGMPPAILTRLKSTLLDTAIRGNEQFVTKVEEQLQRIRGALQKEEGIGKQQVDALPWSSYPEMLLSVSEATIGANLFQEVIQKIILNEEEIKMIENGRQGMRRLAYHEEILLKTSLEILEKHQEELRKARRQVIDLKRKEIKQAIENRDYEIALEKCETAFLFGTDQDRAILEQDIRKYMQEIGFFFVETEQWDMTKKTLDAIGRFKQHMAGPEFWKFSEAELQEQLNPPKESRQEQFRILVRMMDEDYYFVLWLKEIDHNILYLHQYDTALENCRLALTFRNNNESTEVDPELLKRIQEIAFFFVESGNFEKSIAALHLSGHFSKQQKNTSIWEFSKEEWEKLTDQEKKPIHQRLTGMLQSISPDHYQMLWERYFPVMVPVEGGSFQMGNKEEENGEPGYKIAQPAVPVHTVRLDNFNIGRTPVTFWQAMLFIVATGRKHIQPQWGMQGYFPVSGFSWFDALVYANWLSRRMGLEPVYRIEPAPHDANELGASIKDWQTVPDWKANGYRLATEAEWEYAARGGQKSQGFRYAGSDHPNEVCWHSENSKLRPHPAGLKQPNELGLYDMSGLIFEWCWDWQADYREEFAENPKGEDSGVKRIFRGGSFNGDLYQMLIARRDGGGPDSRNRRFGFRLAQYKDSL